MARIDWIESRLLNWARWRLTRGGGKLGFAGVNFANFGAPAREPFADAPIPTSDIEASETDDAINRLPSDLKRTVIVMYIDVDTETRRPKRVRTMAAKLADLGCTRQTAYARIERAQRMLADHFTARKERAEHERRRVEQLQAGLRPG